MTLKPAVGWTWWLLHALQRWQSKTVTSGNKKDGSTRTVESSYREKEGVWVLDPFELDQVIEVGFVPLVVRAYGFHRHSS